METKIKKLVELLNRYRDSYYNHNKSLVSDESYDKLFDELEKLEKEAGFVMSNSPTQTVGYDVKSKLEKITHSHSMLSLGKTKEVNEVCKFINNRQGNEYHDCILSMKLDGLTVLLTYEDGKLIRAETRGNGECGEIITHNARKFMNIPLEITYKEHYEIEGEAIITYKDFKKINDALPDDKKYKNPRNLVSGSVRQLDSSVAAKRNIRFVAWKDPCGKDDQTFSAKLKFAEKIGFDIVPFVQISHNNGDVTSDEIESAINQLKENANVLGIPIDGIVVTYNNIGFGKSLGTTGHHPKHSIAYKFYDETVETTLKEIVWSMGKTGQLTPVAVFEPVEIEGTMVERASVHNVSILEELQLVPGDTITVFKANMIIPQIKENLSKRKDRIMMGVPNICPICGGETRIVEENSTKVLRCDNINCQGTLLGRLSHFVSKNAMNIDGLSEKTLEKFISEGFIESFVDIFELEAGFKDSILELDGFKEKSVNKLFESIKKSRHTTLDRFIYSLCIPLIGRTASKEISNYFKGDSAEFLKALSPKQGFGFNWKVLNDFGTAMHISMTKFGQDNIEEVKELMGYLTFEKPDSTENNILKDKTFVVTGSLEIFKNRDDIHQKIESLGGKVSGSVSKKTSYLINNDLESNSGKNKKAKELNVPIITENEFLNIINNQE